MTDKEARGLTRRELLGAAAAGTAGLVVGGLGGPLVGPVLGPATGTGGGASSITYPFFGEHQAGIVTPVQDHLHFAAFDLVEGASRETLVGLLQEWSYAASRMTQGLDVSASGALQGNPEAPPDDTGEALDLPPSGLTITFGIGPSLFQAKGDRFGIAAERPEELERLPPFVGDALKAAWSHGDLCVQACADDPQVAVHAVRNLSRIAFGRAVIRWSQMGFGRTSKTTAAQQTPRNLMGFKDGTNNILAEDRPAMDEHVWLPTGSSPAWVAGGSYLVVRKIEMLIETWDRVRLTEQEAIFGRAKGTGAPLSGGNEFTVPDFAALAAGGGDPAIPDVAHVRLAHPSNHGGIRILRRGYNYVDGNNPYGRLDAGLFFLAYQRSPAQFVSIQRALSTDVLNEYIRHIGSAVFIVPPGTRQGGFVGETLFG